LQINIDYHKLLFSQIDTKENLRFT